MRHLETKAGTLKLNEKHYAELLRYFDLRYAKGLHIYHRLSFCVGAGCDGYDETCPFTRINACSHYCTGLLPEVAGRNVHDHLSFSYNRCYWYPFSNRWARHYIAKIHKWLKSAKKVSR